jgi:hypothetical protein
MNDGQQHRDAADNTLPKIIWTFWLQGWDEAPEIVWQCRKSWERLNPDWDFRALDMRAAERYVDLAKVLGPNRATASPQAISDILRMNLLADRGGVWVDATVFCCRSLESWIETAFKSGFFVFTNPGPDRLISSWFVASSPANPLTCAVRNAVDRYWSEREFQNARRPRLEKRLGKILGRNPRLAQLWLSAAVKDGLKLHPYFWLHYLFAQTVRDDASARAVWAEAGQRDASGPCRLQQFGFSKPPDATLAAEIDHASQPLYKLDARAAAAASGTGGALDYLLASRRSRSIP